ncbi:probable receptor-like protein kinase At5g61350 [Glycine soja]|uniref:probable receptor-like protein kinase At5g61350 n=1 Tax=Glycine soja TaxID=3848 RepID=UPI00103FBA57|nr:probable receptor-like protein kinase At5g61350 [Glycine soja]
MHCTFSKKKKNYLQFLPRIHHSCTPCSSPPSLWSLNNGRRKQRNHSEASFCVIPFNISSPFFLFTPAKCDSSFSPNVNYLIDCGSSHPTLLKDGRTFKSDRETTSLLSTTEDLQISLDSYLSPSVPSSSSLPLHQTARVFQEESTYSFYIYKSGRLWVRLYFFPLPDPSYNLTSAVFSVQTNQHVLLHEFSVRNNDTSVFKEYLVNVSDSRFSLKFKPKKNSFAFINAIEVVSAPDTLISDSATALSPHGEFKGWDQPIYNKAWTDAIVNRIEVMKMSNDADSLDGFFSVDGKYEGAKFSNQGATIATAFFLFWGSPN